MGQDGVMENVGGSSASVDIGQWIPKVCILRNIARIANAVQVTI